MKIDRSISPGSQMFRLLVVGGMLAVVLGAAVLAIWLIVRKPPPAPPSVSMPESGETTKDDRPVDTGYRFRHIRLYPACIALLLKPSAQSVHVVGAEASYFSKPFETAGVKVLEGAEASSPSDIVLVVTKPDWLTGTDFPTGDEWQRLAGMRAPGGLVALHIDMRRLSLGRLKSILSEFHAAFGPYFVWCIGANDYVVTSAVELAADKLYDLFAGEKASEAFADAGVYTPSDVFACYMGRDVEIEPGLQKVDASGRTTVTWKEARQSLESLSAKDASYVRPGVLTPYYIPPMPWFVKGDAEPVVFANTTNAIKGVQAARREFLAGFDDIGEGISTNAIERWSVAAKVNPRDPVLRGLVDVVDLKGRQLLGVGNVNGALGCYEKLLLIRPNDAAIVHNYGVCLKKGGQMEMAAKVFARAVELDPATDEHRVEMVECCAASGHEDTAVQVLDVLIKRHPDDPALKLRSAKLMSIKKGKAYTPDRAIRLAEDAVVQTGWKDRAYVLGLADVYIECGRVKDGVKLKRKMKTMKFDR